MRTLDELIKSLENNCTKCGNCAYAEETYCGEKIRQDALHYLLIWKLIVESERKAHKADVPANPPLTWDELRQMLGKPVWIEYGFNQKRWVVIHSFHNTGSFCYMNVSGNYPNTFWQKDMGEDEFWQAYRKERE